MRIRLTAKITVLIILVLIIGFGVATVLTIKRESELLVEQNKMAARQLIGTLVSSIETAMLSERPDITRGIALALAWGMSNRPHRLASVSYIGLRRYSAVGRAVAAGGHDDLDQDGSP